jgi:hypothetical protein
MYFLISVKMNINTQTEEIWKQIPNYDYFISTFGRVKNKNDRILTLKNNNDYLYARLGRKKTLSVHRLVATIFILNPNDYNEVNHIDGNRSNNNVSNLEWCSRQQNIDHAIACNLVKTHPVPILQYTLDNVFIKEWSGSTEVSKHYNCDRGTIESVCRNKNKTGMGFIWKYKTQPNKIIKELNDKCKIIEDFPNYKVDIEGNIINQHNKILKYVVNRDGQPYVSLCNNGKKKNMYIQQIIAKTFIPNPNNFIYVRHKDKDKYNNKIDNLEWWGTSS